MGEPLPPPYDDSIPVGKMQMKDHIAAYLENRELSRPTEVIDNVDASLIDKVASNYLIVKNILSNLVWQEQMICKLVSRTWLQAVRSLQLESRAPEDYVSLWNNANLYLKQSGIMTMEPLAFLTFINGGGLASACDCKNIIPSQCDSPCRVRHNMLDVIYTAFSAPKNCMLTIRCDYISYMPKRQSPTHAHTIKRNSLSGLPPYACGLYIPKIPGVNYTVKNIKNNEDIYNFRAFAKMKATTETFKGVIVFVTDKYLLHSNNDMQFLECFKEIQTDLPYAMGGCIIDDAISDASDLVPIINQRGNDDFISDNIITVAMFTVPKGTNEQFCKFEMFSLVLESIDWQKTTIERCIREFADTIPQFEHSAVLKLSCIGRDQRHDIEGQMFRAYFPDTTLVGCYGNGELGLNHPVRPPSKSYKKVKLAQELMRDGAPDTIMHSYSTVFVYFGWGRIKSNNG